MSWSWNGWSKIKFIVFYSRGVHRNWISWPKLKIWWTKLEKPKPLSFDLIQFILKQIKTGRLPIYHPKSSNLKTHFRSFSCEPISQPSWTFLSHRELFSTTVNLPWIPKSFRHREIQTLLSPKPSYLPFSHPHLHSLGREIPFSALSSTRTFLAVAVKSCLVVKLLIEFVFFYTLVFVFESFRPNIYIWEFLMIILLFRISGNKKH